MSRHIRSPTGREARVFVIYHSHSPRTSVYRAETTDGMVVGFMRGVQVGSQTRWSINLENVPDGFSGTYADMSHALGGLFFQRDRAPVPSTGDTGHPDEGPRGATLSRSGMIRRVGAYTFRPYRVGIGRFVTYTADLRCAIWSRENTYRAIVDGEYITGADGVKAHKFRSERAAMEAAIKKAYG